MDQSSARPLVNVYIAIGNSDDKLTQLEWWLYLTQCEEAISKYQENIHGIWFSEPRSPFQNCCWCISIKADLVLDLRKALARAAKKYRQDSIAWSEVSTEFIPPLENED